jgi:hypothetical protein
MGIRESTVEYVLRSEDIESLFQHEAPENEYMPEVRGIVNALALLAEDDITEERLTDVIRAVWVRSFGPFSDEEIEMRIPAFQQAAHQIFSRDS